MAIDRRDNASPQPRSIHRLDPGPLLDKGFEALRNAAASPAELTIALLSFHIAIEHHCREILEQHPALPAANQASIWTEDVRWGTLIQWMQQYERLSKEHGALLYKLNEQRNDLCHRQPRYAGLVEQVERFGELAVYLRDRRQPEEWPVVSQALQTLDANTFAVLEHERRHDQGQANVAPPSVSAQGRADNRAALPSKTTPLPVVKPRSTQYDIFIIVGGITVLILIMLLLLPTLPATPS